MVNDGAAMGGAGILIGFAVGAAATRAAGSLLFGIEANDPVTYIAAAAVLLVVVLLSTAVPAWRASRVDPMIALRNE